MLNIDKCQKYHKTNTKSFYKMENIDTSDKHL